VTLDERINDLEDEIRKLKSAINHNNAVSSKIFARMKSEIDKLKSAGGSSKGLGFDIFGDDK
jgi:ribosomal protein S13